MICFRLDIYINIYIYIYIYHGKSGFLSTISWPDSRIKLFSQCTTSVSLAVQIAKSSSPNR